MIMFNTSQVHNNDNLGDGRAEYMMCVMNMCNFVKPPVTEESEIA